MVVNRRVKESVSTSANNNDDSDKSTTKQPKQTKPMPKAVKPYRPIISDKTKMILLPLVCLLAVFVSYYYNIWMMKRVKTPLDEPKIVNNASYTSPENLDRYWGSYRSNLYFGLKTRSENPLNVGMMWFNQFSRSLQMRHWCDHNDRMSKYGWLAHDGRNFGIHETVENPENGFNIRNSWVKRHGGKNGGDWTVRTRVNGLSGERQFVSVIFYFATDYTGWIKSTKNTKRVSVFNGETVDVGEFSVKIDASDKDNGVDLFINQAVGNMSITTLKDSLIQNGYFQKIETKSKQILEYYGFPSKTSSMLPEANFIAYQVSGFLPFQFDVIFESKSLKEDPAHPQQGQLTGSVFNAALDQAQKNFDKKFEDIFALSKANFSLPAIAMAKHTLSNLIGGIGFFTGRSIVKAASSTADTMLYWLANLYTAVPSRSFFPRGFLWDEGFHNILISQWDLEITKDIIGHWLDLMNVEGWIPREVILGDEARAKVPSEFLVQNSAFANPPTLFLPLFSVIRRVNESLAGKNLDTNNPDVVYLNSVYKRLGHWYDWFNTTQIGKAPLSYRWRGRVSDSKSELNAKTLTSGLDDYPRASHPNENERHLDLRCWIALGSKVMDDLSEILGLKSSRPYKEHYEALKDNNILNKLHWSNSQYADFGLHSDNCRLVREKPRDPRTPPNQMPMIREVITQPINQFVNSVGYVSLFPFLLELLDADSPNLDVVMNQMRDPKHMWTSYGLRSLAKSAPLYDKKNTEHDPPYWRGAIWVNINYMALKALKSYASVNGPYQGKAAQIYAELRSNLINNIQKNYESNGYIWEQYNDKTGKGQGTHPFTGWSSLVVMIMAEIY